MNPDCASKEEESMFKNRAEAGKKLALRISALHPEFKKNKEVIVLALPRGGVPVAFEIAKKLSVPLDLILTHKLGAPGNPEFAIGAVAEDGSVYLDPYRMPIASDAYIEEEKKRQLAEIKARIKKYREGRALPPLQSKIVILVDDGIATGATMRAAITLARKARARSVIVAVPLLPSDTLDSLKPHADEIIYLKTPVLFFAIGAFYEEFLQLADEEVKAYLEARR